MNPKEQSSSALRMKPGFYTRYKTLLTRDKAVKKLMRGERQRPAQVEDIMIRRLGKTGAEWNLSAALFLSYSLLSCYSLALHGPWSYVKLELVFKYVFKYKF